ncbi:helix-turn-helix domain-containing protein [Pseudomonas sp.]|uniref:helix-turn-helix domain-containing protein n=1 Tax=Pseudomonas sp. TaxID=306 RepID=UPI004053B20B
MDLKKAFGEALRKIRTCRKLTQEDFSAISSRTYLSTLERGVYSPTIEKLDAIASVLGGSSSNSACCLLPECRP